ncbi:MAG: hypothetical protein GY750_08430 [Lentisphaerae bacterium]|nr:hypothetical protein [Lentisphaerota bacterium]MCP4101436.1 hypothetical protein [Lentisphaerota bacterium]
MLKGESIVVIGINDPENNDNKNSSPSSKSHHQQIPLSQPFRESISVKYKPSKKARAAALGTGFLSGGAGFSSGENLAILTNVLLNHKKAIEMTGGYSSLATFGAFNTKALLGAMEEIYILKETRKRVGKSFFSCDKQMAKYYARILFALSAAVPGAAFSLKGLTEQYGKGLSYLFLTFNLVGTAAGNNLGLREVFAQQHKPHVKRKYSNNKCATITIGIISATAAGISLLPPTYHSFKPIDELTSSIALGYTLKGLITLFSVPGVCLFGNAVYEKLNPVQRNSMVNSRVNRRDKAILERTGTVVGKCVGAGVATIAALSFAANGATMMGELRACLEEDDYTNCKTDLVANTAGGLFGVVAFATSFSLWVGPSMDTFGAALGAMGRKMDDFCCSMCCQPEQESNSQINSHSQQSVIRSNINDNTSLLNKKLSLAISPFGDNYGSIESNNKQNSNGVDTAQSHFISKDIAPNKFAQEYL